MMKKTILVTGGAGFIGSALAAQLLRAGHRVKIADNLWRGTRSNVARLAELGFDVTEDFTEVDLSDAVPEGLLSGCDCVVHLADIVAGVEFTFNNEYYIFQNNLRINTNVFSAAVTAEVPHIIYVGTACSYPKEKQMNPNGVNLFKEDDVMPAEPESGYGWSKLIGEYECRLSCRGSKTRWSIARLHNVYGPGVSLDTKEDAGDSIFDPEGLGRA